MITTFHLVTLAIGINLILGGIALIIWACEEDEDFE